MDPQSVTGWSELIAGVVAAGVAVTVAWRRWVRPTWRWAKDWMERQEQRQQVIEELVKAQLQPNGGSSLLDTVRRIDSSQKQNERHFKSLDRRLAEVNKRLLKVEAATATATEVPDE